MNKQQRATEIVRTLQKNGFQAFFVGGSVRDLLLKRRPKDFDIATSAKPDEVGLIFNNFHEVGKQFGVLLLDFPEGNFEVATFRAEDTYSDKRRPDKVVWANAKDDVLRRDFTINGLLYDPVNKQTFDYVQGQRDIEVKVIRFIGDPLRRITEDPVRMLRAIRFKNQLNFQYDKDSYGAIRKLGSEINHVAKERVGQELQLMMADSNRLQCIKDLDRLGLLKIILPEVDLLKGVPQPEQFHQEGDVFDHSLKALGALNKDAPAFLAWATLLHDVAKAELVTLPANQHGRIKTEGHASRSAQIAKQILNRLRYPKIEVESAAWMIAHHMSLKDIDNLRPSKREAYVLDPRFPWLLELHHADAAGAIPQDLSLYNEALKTYQKMKVDHEYEKKHSLKPLLNGYDITRELQIDPSPIVGTLLEQIRDKQLKHELTTKAEAIAWAKQQPAKI
ncbi:CCA tRNA nucleotidyltransferase [Candidatus Berkelbacteria bacterium]|nr:CCA tRNA nucleotidyltransferase [Candidatus Berkelbacteria bacterium]